MLSLLLCPVWWRRWRQLHGQATPLSVHRAASVFDRLRVLVGKQLQLHAVRRCHQWRGGDPARRPEVRALGCSASVFGVGKSVRGVRHVRLRLVGVVKARIFCVVFGLRREVRPGSKRRRTRLDPTQRQDVPADLGGDFIQLPPDLDRAGKQRALTRPVEISGR